jgi:hypothetical protein
MRKKMDNPKIGNRIPEFPDMDSIAKDLFPDPTQPNPTQPTPTDGVVPLREIGKLFISLMSYTFFFLELKN